MVEKCKCGEVAEVQTISFIDDCIMITCECLKCERRIHRMYRKNSETYFLNGDIEKKEIS